MMETKSYTRRDSALKALRKAGIKPEHYDDHLTKGANGLMVVTLPGTGAKPQAAKAPAKVKKERERKKPAGPTVAGTIRELIKAGKTNAEIWKQVQPRFGLDDAKKHYPAWYRAELVRRQASK